MVNNPVRIGLMGTHSTGKTLLARRLEMELRALGVTAARTSGLGKRAATAGFPKMHHHTTASTEWVITTGAADELATGLNADVVVAERAAPDALAYYTAALEHRGEQADHEALERLHLLVATQVPKYDLLIATVLDPEQPVHRGHRGHDYNDDFRTLVDQNLHQLLAEQSIGHINVTSDPASQDTAIHAALTTAQTLEAAA